MTTKPKNVVLMKNNVVKAKDAVAREEYFWAEECPAPTEKVLIDLT
jgi:hypothetical protein